jgi:hypothetical protein
MNMRSRKLTPDLADALGYKSPSAGFACPKEEYVTKDLKKKKLNLYHQRWSIDERARIQHTLLALYTYVESSDPHAAEALETVVLDNLIAAAFALWRAVFLAADIRTTETVHKSQQDFLASLISTNAITFSDDKRNSAWTCGFYLDAAKARLKHTDYVLREGMHLTPSEAIENLTLIKGHNNVAHTRYEWMCAHRALRILFNTFYIGSGLEVPGVNMALTDQDSEQT